jgi:hypothetical protein
MRENQQRSNPAALIAAVLSLFALFLLNPGAARAQWTQDANGNVNNTNPGNVRVGGSGTPTSVLHTKGNLSSQLTGTVAVTQNSAAVTGTGTAFTTELSVGDSIKIGTSIFTVSAISSATSLTLDANYTSTTASGLSAFRDPGLLAVDNGAGSSKLTVDRAGKVGIGTATPSSRLSIVETVTTASRGISVAQYSSDTTAALLNLTKLRGAPGAPVSVANGDTLGLISANAYTGGYLATAGIHFIVNGTVSPSAAPTDIVFKAGNTGFGPERMRITSGGNVGIGNPAPSFPLDVAGLVRSSSGGFVFPDGTTQATALSFGSTAGTAVQGNTALTVAAGAGMSGGGTATLGGGGTLTLTNSDRGSSQNIFKNVGNAAGATQFSAGSNADTLRFEGTGGTTVSFDSANRKVVINSSSASGSGWTDAGTSVYPTSLTAKVGVGTSGPSAGLDVQTPVTAATANGVRLQQTLTAQINNGVLNGLYINPTFTDGVAVGNVHNALATGAGNVGIGTTATGAGLDVQNAGGISGGNSYGARFQQTIPSANNNTVSTAVYIDPTFSDGMAVGVKHNGLVVTSGNVGLGTSTPLTGLTGNGGMELYVASAVATLKLNTGLAGKNNAQVRFSGVSGDNWAIGSDVATNNGSRDFHFYDFAGAPGGRLTIQSATGNVGIGTSAPNTAKLVIAGTAGSPGLDLASSDVYAEMRVIRNSVGASDKDLYLQYQAGVNSRTHIYSSNVETVTVSGGKVGIGKTTPAEALDVVGNIRATGSVSATYQDVAEWVPSSQKLSAGTVVVLDTVRSNHVLASTSAYDTKVAGVVSAEPGVILGVGGEDKLKVATTGRVKVRVDATRSPIKVGDLLVTGDTEGVAMKSVEVDLGGVKIHRPGTIIGKALESLEKGTGEILVLLSLQ